MFIYKNKQAFNLQYELCSEITMQINLKHEKKNKRAINSD